MAAAPRNALLTFMSADRKRTYTYNVYLSDVAAAFARFNTVQAAGASDETFITAPEDMFLADASVPTGLTDTTSGTLWINDGPVANSIMAWSTITSTLSSRSFPVWKIRGGRKVQIKQNA